MSKDIGKLFSTMNDKMIILCTGNGLDDSENRFAGVVVHNAEPVPAFPVGTYSKTWTWHPQTFRPYTGVIVLDGSKWKEHVEIADSGGG